VPTESAVARIAHTAAQEEKTVVAVQAPAGVLIEAGAQDCDLDRRGGLAMRTMDYLAQNSNTIERTCGAS